LKVLSTLPGILVSDIWADSQRLATLHLGDDPGHSMLTIWDADGHPVSETSLAIAWEDIHCPICLDAPIDYSLIAIALKDGSIAVFEQSSGGILQVLGEGEQFTLPRPRFSRDGELLAVGSDILIVWEVESGRELLRRSDVSPFGAIDFHPNGQHIAYGTTTGATGEGSVSIVDINSNQVVSILHGHVRGFFSIGYNNDGLLLATISFDGTARTWFTPRGFPVMNFPLDASHHGTDVAFYPVAPYGASVVYSHGGSLIVTALERGSIQVWGYYGKEWLNPANKVLGYCGINYSSDGSLLASAQCDHRVFVVDPLTRQTVAILTNPRGSEDVLRFPVFSPDSTRLAALTLPDNLVLIYDLATGLEIVRLTGHTDRIYKVVYHPDGSRLATISIDNTVRLWDAHTGEEIYVLYDLFNEPIIQGDLMNIIFSPDGSKFATAAGSSVKIWETDSGVELVSLPSEMITSYAYALAFSPDATRLAVGLRSGVGSSVWDVLSGKKLFDLTGQPEFPWSIAFSPDGKQIATVNTLDGNVRLWDADTGTAQMTLYKYTSWPISFIAYRPDGLILATQGAGGLIRFIPTRTEDIVELAHSRLTRWFTLEECRRYLHLDACPPPPHLSNWHDR
jgi:WD40 repeat protein